MSSTATLIEQAPARYGGSAGLVFLALTYIGFSLVVPLVILGLAVVQLLVPFTLQRQRQLETLAEALRAWSALPVFVISIAIVMQQIEMVSGFMVGNPCHQLG